jgi:signal transduction histidine kinase
LSRMVRSLTWVVVAICFCAYAALVYGGVTAPVLPYASNLPYTVAHITRPEDAGNLQALDNIIEFNGYPFFTCMYPGAFTPVYDAPRDREINVSYWRPNSPDSEEGKLYETRIILRHPGPHELLNRISNYLVGAVLLAVGAFFLIFRWPQLRLLLVGCMLAGLLLTSVPDTAMFIAPYNVIYSFGLPLWAIASVVALAHWPLNQLNFRIPRFLIGIVTVLAIGSCVTNLLGWMGASCAIPSTENLVLIPFGRDLRVPTGLLFNARFVSSLGISLTPLPSLMYLLLSAYRNTTNRFIRTQIRTLAWVHAVVWTLQLMFSFIPVLIGIGDVPVAPILLTSLSLFQPIAWAVVGYRSTIIGVEHFLNRTLFALLLLVTAIIVLFAGFYALLNLIPDPDPILITILAVVPLFLFSTVLRRSFEKVVDIVLYGHYYDYEETVSALMQDLTAAVEVRSIGRVLTQNIPEALLIECAAFWARTPEDNLALIATWNVSTESLPNFLAESELQREEGIGVVVHSEPFQLGTHVGEWHVTVKLASGSMLEGVLLLGSKLRGRSYSEKDTRVLLSLANWIGGRLAGWRLTEIEMRHDREQTLMLIEHEATIRSQVAQELHDRGITAVSLVRHLVERGQSSDVVQEALQQVIDDLRLLTSTRLKPSGLDYGLLSGLAVMVQEYRQLGADIELELATAEDSPIWRRLSEMQNRELFYVVREAVTNAYKADNEGYIVVVVVDDGGCLHLSVRDKGPGFDATETTSVLHHGLSIMHARARHIRAQLTIQTEKGVGTTVRISLPLLTVPEPASELSIS